MTTEQSAQAKSTPHDPVVACIGVGNVGRAWAVAFANGGYQVRLFDKSSAQIEIALAAIDRTLKDLEESGLASAHEVRRRIVATPGLEATLDGVVHVQESIPENLAIKQAMFRELDELSPPQATLASSTSEIRGSLIFGGLRSERRCLVAHPLNPPSILPLVELCPTPNTDPQVTRQCRELFLNIGHQPIVLKKEIDGFIANRLQLALLGEALHLVSEGYCEPEDIDVAMTRGLALRWAVIGPFETGHLNASAGYRSYLDLYGATHRKIIDDLRIDHPWSEELIDHIHNRLSARTPVAEVPARQAWRDRELMRLAKHLAGGE